MAPLVCRLAFDEPIVFYVLKQKLEFVEVCGADNRLNCIFVDINVPTTDFSTISYPAYEVIYLFCERWTRILDDGLHQFPVEGYRILMPLFNWQPCLVLCPNPMAQHRPLCVILKYAICVQTQYEVIFEEEIAASGA